MNVVPPKWKVLIHPPFNLGEKRSIQIDARCAVESTSTCTLQSMCGIDNFIRMVMDCARHRQTGWKNRHKCKIGVVLARRVLCIAAHAHPAAHPSFARSLFLFRSPNVPLFPLTWWVFTNNTVSLFLCLRSAVIEHAIWSGLPAPIKGWWARTNFTRSQINIGALAHTSHYSPPFVY